MAVKSSRERIAWQKAMDFAVAVYRVTADFPKEEMYGLAHQLRKAAVSVPSNIAEGQGRRSTRDFLHFLSIAYGSLNESETQLLLAERLEFVAAPKATTLLTLSSEVGRLINGLVNSLAEPPNTDRRFH